MVAWNEKFSHSENLASDGSISPDVIEGFDFTKRSEEARGGSVVNFGGAGCRKLSDASPLRRRSPAPLNRNDPETELYYVRNRMCNPVLGRWAQRDPIGYSGGINLYEYVNGRAVVELDPEGLLWGVVAYLCGNLAKRAAKAIAEGAKAAAKAADDRLKLDVCPPPHGLKRLRLELDQAKEVAKSGEAAVKAAILIAAMGELRCPGVPAGPTVIPGIPGLDGEPGPIVVPEV